MAFLVDESAYPVGQLVVAEFGVLVDTAFLLDSLVGSGAFVKLFVPIAEGEDGLWERVFEVVCYQIPFRRRDVLCLFDQHQLYGRHHGELLGVGYDGGHVNVTPIEHVLVKVAKALLHDVALKEVGNVINVVILLACNEVNGSIFPCLYVVFQLLVGD